ncbi:MAG: acyltransferase [bacterium]|nr:acyltransferase [bacterium]
MRKPLRTASVQFEHVNGDKPANLAVMRGFVERAARQGVQTLAFPECCISGYWGLRDWSRERLTGLAEPVFDGESARTLAAWSAEFGMTIGAGLIERDGSRLFNTYVVAMPDGAMQRHRKIHAFVNEALSCGDEFTVFDTPHGWRMGVLICYDNNLVENARINALMGAELILAPHQTGGCRSRSPHAMGVVDRALWDRRHEEPGAIEAEFHGEKGRGWLMRWLPARAHDNGLFYLFSNGVGVDDDEVRTGNAMILDPYGRILTETGRAGDDMVIADLDPDLQPMSTGRRWLKARRPELYAKLTELTGNEAPIRAIRMGEDG